MFAKATLEAKAHQSCFSNLFDYQMNDPAPNCAAKSLSPTIGAASSVANSSFDTAMSTLSRRSVVDATDPLPAAAERNICANYSLNGDPANVLDDERSASAPISDGLESGKDHKKKVRRRRGHGRRKWKPYHKLSTEEKRELADREEKRAEKSRAERFAHGQPMAPYNTTQFLLNDREERTTNRAEGDVDALIDIAQRARAPSGSDAGNTSETGSGGGAGGSHSDSDEFERDFEAEYDSANVERLDTLSRADLIREYLSLERELENAMSENRELRRENGKLRAAAPRSPLPPLPNDTSTTLTV